MYRLRYSVLGYFSCNATWHINNWAAMTVSSPVSVTGSQKRTHSSKAKARETVGGRVWEGGKQGSWEQRVECPSSHDITQMALFLGSTWRGCVAPPLLLSLPPPLLWSHTNHLAHSQMCNSKHHPARETTHQNKHQSLMCNLTQRTHLLIYILRWSSHIPSLTTSKLWLSVHRLYFNFSHPYDTT